MTAPSIWCGISVPSPAIGSDCANICAELRADRGRRAGGVLRQGQAELFAIQDGIVGEARLVERAFGLRPCALTEVMVLLQDRLANAET